MNNIWLEPTELTGDSVALRPLHSDDIPGLQTAVSDGDIWKVRVAEVPKPDDMANEVARRLKQQDLGEMVPFTVRNPSDDIIGMTCYNRIDHISKRTDIGWTWYAKRVQRTSVNTECKTVMLRHVFENLDAIAVGFRVDALNFPSQRAVERIGAKKEGLIRNYSRLSDGSIRDMYLYSIINVEWPNIKAHLKWLSDTQR